MSLKFKDEGRVTSHVAWALILGLILAIWQARTFQPVIVPTVFLFVVLSTIAAFDARFFIIPDLYLLAMTGIGLSILNYSNFNLILDRFGAAVLSFSLVRALDIFYRALRGLPGIGRGDAKLLAAGAIWVGLEGLPTVVFWASISGLIAVATMRFSDQELSKGTAIAFGPHLALAIWLVWLFGPISAGTS